MMLDKKIWEIFLCEFKMGRKAVGATCNINTAFKKNRYSVVKNLSKLWETVKDREVWHTAVHGVAVGHNLMTEQQPRHLGVKSWSWQLSLGKTN